MSLLQNSNAISAPADTSFYDYEIANSCRFNRADGSYLSRTIQSGGNLKKWTFSCWFKLTASAGFGGNQYYLMTEKSGSPYDTMIFDVDSDNLFYYQVDGKYLKPKGAMRDPTGWGHLVVVYDSGNSADDRRIVYLNGTRLGVNSSQSLSHNVDSSFNSNTVHYIGARQDNNASYYGDFYLADVIWSDGYAYAPTEFAETKKGTWIPKEFSGSYGTTGYHLKFESSSDLGNDSSGNNNDWTVNNISAHDQLKDSPTHSFCIQSSIANPYNVTIKEGGLKTAGGWVKSTFGTFPITNKGSWYWEYVTDGYVYAWMGLQSIERAFDESGHTHGIDFSFVQAGEFRYDGSNETSTGSIGTGDIVGVWVNDGVIKIYVNNSLDHTYSQQLVAGRVYYPTTHGTNNTFINYGADSSFANQKTSGSANASDANGHGDFYYEPKGLALCSANMEVVDAIDPNQSDDYPSNMFGSVRYTGNNGQQELTLGFQADLIWPRDRKYSQNWYWVDSSRGLTGSNGVYVLSNSNGVEADFPQDNFTAVSSTSITVSGGTWFSSGTHSMNIKAWRYNGGTTVNNTSGDLDSTVQLDPSGHASIVLATGDGGSSGTKTIGHGLNNNGVGVAPDLIIAKNRDSAFNWDTYWSVGTTSGYGIRLNTTDGELSGRWGTVNSSIFTTTYNYTWVGSDKFVYYCFAKCPGWIDVTTYVGNGDVDGPYVGLNCSPAWVWIRKVGGAAWPTFLKDMPESDTGNSAATTTNSDRQPHEWLNLSDAVEYTDTSNNKIDFLAQGIKIREDNSSINGDGSKYVVFAVADVAAKYALAQ